MCGLVGVVVATSAALSLYDALTLLQHRGQDAVGIATSDGVGDTASSAVPAVFCLRKANGTVRDVFGAQQLSNLQGRIGIGHVRYPTAGSRSEAEAQPFYVNFPYGIALAHNGTLTNAKALRQNLYENDRRHLNTDSDSEVLLNVLASELMRCGRWPLTQAHVFAAMRALYQRCRGGYAVVAMISGLGLLGFRDPHGIRPLVYGVKSGPAGQEVMLASESVALEASGYRLVADVAPGEVIIVGADGQLTTQQCAPQRVHTPCIFEYVYFARPDSIIDGISVYKTRLRMGEKLAERILQEYPDHDIDVVIPVPETSRTAAIPLANRLQVKLREGFVKNRYIGRTFIMPGQALRQRSVKQKLNPIGLEFKGKNVLLVDDSIVRGTTSKEIIQMARQAGAKKVYFVSAAPPVRYPNVYGIDMPTADELIAHNRSTAEMEQVLGADRLFFQSLADLEAAAREGNPAIERFESAVFNGQYITGDIDAEYLHQLRQRRHGNAADCEPIQAHDIGLSQC